MAKVGIIGIDGGSFTVIDYLVGQGRLPNLARKLGGGSRATLRSTIPPLTPAAWASFYTGTNAGKHGVVDFFTRVPDTYKLSPVNASKVKGETLWSIASSEGRRVCIYNVPMTYPAAPVNGVMISGMDSPRLDEKAVFPAEFRNELMQNVPEFTIEPRVDVKYLVKNSADPVGEYEQKLRQYMETELKTIGYLMDREDWDLFIAVVRTIDILQHVFWRSAESVISGDGSASADDERRAEIIFSCYERLDAEIGGRWAEWANDRDLIFMSDHGFGELRGEVCLNRILAEAGLLKFRKKGRKRKAQEFLHNRLVPHIPPRLRWGIKRYMRKDYETGRAVVLYVDALVSDIDWNRTRVYSLAQFGCVYVNLKGREPMGFVNGEDERLAVLAEAEAALAAFKHPDDGEPVVTEFHRKEDIYSGPLEYDMPDMVIAMRDYAYRGVYSTYSELEGGGLVRTVFPERKQLAHTGNHRLEGVLILDGPDISSDDLGSANMVDIAPTALNLLGIAVPESWDGDILAGAFVDGEVREVEPSVERDQAVTGSGNDSSNGAGSGSDPDSGEVLTEEDEEEVRKRLQDLGYL